MYTKLKKRTRKTEIEREKETILCRHKQLTGSNIDSLLTHMIVDHIIYIELLCIVM